MNNRKRLAGTIIIFIIGCSVGAITVHYICTMRMDQMWRGGPVNMKEAIIKHIATDLNLNQEQKKKLSLIMESMHKKMRVIHKQSFPQIKIIIEEADNNTMSILSVDQKEKFEKIIEQRRKHDFFNEN
ncbi:hypothetical protein [Candidatus Magnetomonas plexicatena]|uniref:hypothetical protein n=1 Tax=Candidatus Magnetomonas plexicatena TaxID=2552947 RepID=UPI001C7977C4|nr:hypothetical protein E2O03_003060 [Nitrospirales bacterium LBB_01]